MDIGEKEREIIEGLRTGKLNIHDLTQANPRESKEEPAKDRKEDRKEDRK
jgi:hypothetical protein